MSGTPADRVPYRVLTGRLLLRCWSPADTGAFRAAVSASDGHLRPWIPFMKAEPRTFAQTCQWLREARASFDRDLAWHYAVFDRAGGELLGGNMLNPRVGEGGLELGYWTVVHATGKGLAGEATRAMIRCAFELHGATRVEIHCSPENRASAAIPARLGFTHEATLKSRVVNAEERAMDLMIWSLFADDYSSSSASREAIEAYDCAGRQLALSPAPGTLR